MIEKEKFFRNYLELKNIVLIFAANKSTGKNKFNLSVSF